MDSLTHLIAGAAAPLAIPKAPRRMSLVVMGILAGELPDYDIFFGAGSIEQHLSFHRGITHALLWQPVLALFLVLPFYVFFSATKEKGTFRFFTLYCIALFALYMHVFLDCMTTFGTQIFLPFSAYRVAVPAMFIVDPFITLPSLCLLWYALQTSFKSDLRYTLLKTKSKFLDKLTSVAWEGKLPPRIFSGTSGKLARLVLCWMLIYPLLSLSLREFTRHYLEKSIATPQVEQVELLTEPFSPLIWKVVIENNNGFWLGTYSYFTSWRRSEFVFYEKSDQSLLTKLGAQRSVFADYQAFCPNYMVQKTRPATGGDKFGKGQERMTEYIFSDLRYEVSVHSPALFFRYNRKPFVLEARVSEDSTLVAYRFLLWGDENTTLWIFL